MSDTKPEHQTQPTTPNPKPSGDAQNQNQTFNIRKAALGPNTNR